MYHPFLLTVNDADEALFAIAILVVFLFLVALCIVGIGLSRRPDSLSPYTQLPMRRGSDLSYFSSEKVLRFLYHMHQYDNRIFDLRRAAVCRETGRIFPNAIDWFDKIRVDWSFIQKRHPGKYVSWGSLSAEQQEIVRCAHDTLEGFQTEFSSSTIIPKAIETQYAYAKPGPLYVDIETNTLLGWKCVPDTELEVLVVQKPVKYITLSIS